ncbi:MAG: HNH endonuclease [Muribaculaceae bacterium]|nr:HNH endonuclease [Muribaculaceae bacterium]
MARDREYIKLINNRRWRELRLSVLSREPLCRRCAQAGRVRQAREVHHVQPIQTGVTPWERERLAYDPANLMPLCPECHQREHEHLGSKGKAEQTSRRKAETAEFMRRFYGEELGAEGADVTA